MMIPVTLSAANHTMVRIRQQLIRQPSANAIPYQAGQLHYSEVITAMIEPFNLTSLSDKRLLSLIPIELVEKLAGRNLEWHVAKTFKAIQSRPMEHYNDIVNADTHERHKGKPPSEHPLHKYFAEYSESPKLAKLVGYRHNQAMITAETDREMCLVLHFGSAYPNSLHLAFIYLQNPAINTSRPMDPWLEHPGFGNGVCNAIISNLTSLARECHFNRITTYAIDPLRQRIFCKRGFTVDTESDLYPPSQQNFIQIPLKIDLK